MQIEQSTHVVTLLPGRGIPMTREVHRRLEGEAHRLEEFLPRLKAIAREDGVSGDPETPTVLAAGDLHIASRRLEILLRVLAEAYVVEPDGQAVVGSRVTVRHGDGDRETYELVAPGEAEARLRRISPDAPLGAALLGRRGGELAEMEAPNGLQQLEILRVA